MKTSIFSTIVALGALSLASSPAGAQQINTSQLPSAVQKTISTLAGTISSIHQVNLNGNQVYEVDVAGNHPVYVTSSGQLANPSTGQPEQTSFQSLLGTLFGQGQTSQSGNALTIAQLPLPVQNTVRAQVGSLPVQSITQVTNNGTADYLVSFGQNGQQQTLEVNPSGQIVQNPSGALAQNAPVSVPNWRTAPIRQPLSGATQVNVSTLPAPVRNTFLSYAGGQGLATVKQGRVGGRTIYEATVSPTGNQIALRVDASGAVVNDQVDDLFLSQLQKNRSSNQAMGQAPGSQSASGTANSFGISTLNNPQAISFNQLPLAAQTTISAQAGGAPLDRIEQGTIDNGRAAYDVTYNRGGQPVTLRVGADGAVLSSPTP